MNRGSNKRKRNNNARNDASMRPRFMNRGSAHSDGARIPQVAASMRPRFMNRGSDGDAGRPLLPVRGFNEAPIHESGK